ncbi:hypothetical protein JCM5353_005822 [Sporobolomyces roseus]
MSEQTAEQLRDLLQQAAGNAATSSEGTLETMGEAIRHNVPLPEEAADILKTIGKLKTLKPLYTYAIYHPLRFLLHYLILPLPSLLLFLLIAIFQILASILQTLFLPFSYVVHFLTAPARISFTILNALMPLWIFLGTAILIGCLAGAAIGLLMGDTTRFAMERTLDVVVWPLRVMGFVEPPKERKLGGRGGFGAKGGARLETVPKRRRPSSNKGKVRAVESNGNGKVKREDPTTTDDELDLSRSSTTLVGGSTSRGSQRLHQRHSMGISSSSSSSSSEEDVTSSSNGLKRGRSVGTRRKGESGWRKRHVEDVLQ